MAKFFLNGKWKKRGIAAASAALALTFSLGMFTACGSPDNNEDDDDDSSSATEVDTQLLKNGNFEFYSEKDKELDKKRALINTPTSWSFSSGSPSSKTTSGIVNTAEWDYLTKAGYDNGKGFPENGEGVDASAVMKDVAAHWNDEGVTAYDRLKFYEDFKKEIKDLKSDSDEAKLFADYKYSVDYEDVEKLREELGGELKTHDGDENNNGVLMIHNSVEQYDVLGTAQSYSSSTTINLSAGTAAKVSVWVKTSNLKHYYADNAVEVLSDAGAYIGVTNTVGGSTLDQMQIKNINTRSVTENNGWQEYTVYVRANTFASSSFKLVLGLGMGNSDNRLEAVDGYALFDDLTCEMISFADYEAAVNSSFATCELNSKKDEKIFDATALQKTHYALDLHATFDALDLDVTFDTTKETNGPKTYDAADIIEDNRNDGQKGSVVGSFTYNSLKNKTNDYLTGILAKDFDEAKYPFEKERPLVMLLSTNGMAYTATVNGASANGNSKAFTIEPNKYMLVSFFVKTSSIRAGKTGAGAVLVDGENETAISAFDSTTVSTVDINDEKTDIYDGWVQCFFFVRNETDETRSFSLKLTYGPTSIATSTKNDYADGYAAFANFETMSLTKTQFGYVSASGRTQTVSLTGKVSADSKFDDNSASTPFTNGGLGTPANFAGKQSGTIEVVGDKEPLSPAELEKTGLYTGLLNSEYVDEYVNGTAPWNQFLGKIGGTNADTWWNNIFADGNRTVNQPLVIMNTSKNALPAYGYFAKTASVSSEGQQISMRVKVGGGAKAYLYLIDTSDAKAGFNSVLAPQMPSVTYWYDDEGNILAENPEGKKKPVVAYYLESNGLYVKAEEKDGKNKTYYANLTNYKKDDDGNLVTSDDKIAFYLKDGKYYAYYDKKTDKYTQEVAALPTEGDFVRYSAPDFNGAGTCVAVDDTHGEWVTVSFFVRTGSKSKNFRLELWAGSRDGKEQIPQNGYVFFDEYESGSVSDFDKTLQGYVDDVKDDMNTAANKKPGDEGYIGKNDNLPKSSGAHYYTFTFYDSPDYLRYDETVDKDWLGYNYTQSEQKEKLIWFEYDKNGTYAQFLDYSANDQSVSKVNLKDDTTSGDNSNSSSGNNTANILTIVSSVIFAFAVVFACVAVIVRKVMKKKSKSGKKHKQKKEPKEKQPKLKMVKSEETPEEEPEDENNPYNE